MGSNMDIILEDKIVELMNEYQVETPKREDLDSFLENLLKLIESEKKEI
jgi:hypothetical protein